jgi:hypothetical protein
LQHVANTKCQLTQCALMQIQFGSKLEGRQWYMDVKPGCVPEIVG